MGVYGKVSEESFRVFRDEDFAFGYCLERGRPSCPPSLLATARLLQHYAGISDAEVVDRCRYDLRWKVALDLDLASTSAPFTKSTFQLFRSRLSLHEKEGLIFERSVTLAAKAGLLPKKLEIALDSSPVRGRGAVKDTFNLLSDAILKVLRSVASAEGCTLLEAAAKMGLERHVEATSIKGSVALDWTNSAAVASFLSTLVEDCERALALAAESGVSTSEVSLLEKILEQDIEPGKADQPPTLRRGVAKDRVVSATDPEMRHGRKSSGSRYDGHKAHVAVDTKSGVITAIDASSPGEPDGAQVQSLLHQTKKNTALEVTSALGDCAYSSAEAARQAKEEGANLKTRMPSSRKGIFGPAAFTVSEDGSQAQCPAGHSSHRHAKHANGNAKGIQHRWTQEQCSACPLRDQCTKGKRRTLFVRSDFHERRRREEHAKSPQGLMELRRRVKAEHAIARLKNLGAGVARYFGRAKTRAQWLWTAAMANLTLIWKACDASKLPMGQ